MGSARIPPSVRFLAAGLALAALYPAPAHAAAPKLGVVAGSGSSSGGVFTAGPDGAEYVLPTMARLSIAPGASVRIFTRSQKLQLGPGSKTTTYSFSLLHGHVDVQVPSKPWSAVLCSVGKVSTIVIAGQATILAHDQESTVASAGGDVRTLFGSHWLNLKPGTEAHFNSLGASKPEPSIAAPAFGAGQRLWFSPGDPISIGGFSFAAVTGAEHYELRLRAQDGSEETREVRGATRLEQPFSSVTPGEYQLSARSVDREGIAGMWSAAEPIRVVGVVLPPGAYSANGDIFLGKGQEVHFSHTDGLEMTYQGAGRYIPASQAVSLYRGETTVVSFRVPGSLYPTSARLRPRGLYARVMLGPSRAVWPTDPIKIAIELRNHDGAKIPQWLELKPDVTLGIDPVEVSFTREGNRLVGTVPPIDKPGPWVLRVEVKDQFGALLGRDFLEIAEAPPAPPPHKAANAARVASQ